jgi:diguanylate cyclase (GGDEF)-like protein
VDKRAYPRTETNIQATYTLSGDLAKACEIIDYSQTGMQLRYAQSSQDRLRSGDSIELNFILQENNQKGSYRLQGEVAHSDDETAGIRLSLIENETFSAIQRISQHAAQSDKKQNITPEIKEKYKAFFIKESTAHCQAIIKDLFPILSDHLLQSADKANTNSKQRELFDLMQTIESQRETISSRFISEISAHLTNWSNQLPPINKDQKQSNTSSMSIVKKGNFENWLVIKVTASRLQSRFSNLLFELRPRIDTLSKAKLLDKHNPMSPAVICQSFAESQRDITLNTNAKQIIFNQFELVANRVLEQLYKSLNSEIETNFTPNYKPTPTQQAPTSTPNTDHETSTELNDTQEGSAQLNTPQDNAALNSSNTNNPAHSFINRHNKGGQAVQHTRSMLGSLQADITRNREVAEQAYNSVKNLLGMRYSRGGNQNGTNDQYLSQPESELDVSEVLGILDELQQEPMPAVHSEQAALTERIQAQMPTMENGDAMQLRAEDNQSVTMVESLFEQILSNKNMNPFAQEWMKQLELPIAKVMLQDSDLLQAEEHPARQVINQLGRLGMMGAMSNANQRKSIEDIINNIAQNYTSDLNIFDEALLEFNALIDTQGKITQRNAERVAKACEGEERVVNAKNQVEKEIDKRIAGKRIARAFSLLLDDGWRDLLTVVYIRSGDEDPRWKGALKVLDKLQAVLSPKNHGKKELLPKVAPLLGLIKKELNQVSSDAYKHDNIIKELKIALKTTLGEGKEAESILIPSNDRKLNNTTEDNPLDINTISLMKWVDKAKSLNKGDWLEIQKDDHIIQVSVAWIAQDHSKFALVNHQGMKALDYTLDALAKNMKEGKIRLLEEQDTPIVDLGLDNMVQSIYSELTFQATHDEITKLPNRKAFRAQLEKDIMQIKKLQNTAVFCFLDIDQFKLINNACGYEGGDKIIADLAEVIKGHLDDGTLIARIGGNEFGILFYDTNKDQGLVKAKKLKNLIQKTRFSWKERPYNVTASMGLVELNELTNSATELFESADTACLSAKEAGRNKIEVYTTGNTATEQQDNFMLWSTKLTRALEDNKLALMCQEIVPVEPDSELKPHFEFQLAVLNGDVPELPPHDFFHAAKHYNRMHMIDRWAISKLMFWMSKQGDKRNEIDGFTLKLSGYSLNDERLMEFIFDQASSQNIPMTKLCFEITETGAITNLGDATDFMEEMKKIGCKFSLTDFGTGQSSYAYLRKLPVDFVKIDSTFIKSIAEDETDYAMVKSINEIAHFMKKQTIADCVNDSASLEKIREIGVNYAQGNAFPAPVLLKDI